ncbi:MAG: 2OG-Fe(II) oxygenase family protein [Pseudonocardiaceae bacterium]
MQNLTDIDFDALSRFDERYISDRSACIDNTLQSGGILRLTNFSSSADEVRNVGRSFFGLPSSVKSRYAMTGGTYSNGWGCVPVSNGCADESATNPNILEFFRCGPASFSDDASKGRYYPINQWPSELPDLQRVLTRYSRRMLSVGGLVLRMLTRVLTIEESFFVERTRQTIWSQGVNYYSSLGRVGPARDSQLRMPSHTDFSTVSLIERDSNSIPLQVESRGSWSDVRHDDRTVIVILGDMMERWTGGRWRATQHRVSAPLDDNSDEDLISLVFFLAADSDAIISPLPEPCGGSVKFEPIKAGEYILQKMAALRLQ